jgi:hypothetical protein
MSRSSSREESVVDGRILEELGRQSQTVGRVHPGNMNPTLKRTNDPFGNKLKAQTSERALLLPGLDLWWCSASSVIERRLASCRAAGSRGLVSGLTRGLPPVWQ